MAFTNRPRATQQPLPRVPSGPGSFGPPSHHEPVGTGQHSTSTLAISPIDNRISEHPLSHTPRSGQQPQNTKPIPKPNRVKAVQLDCAPDSSTDEIDPETSTASIGNVLAKSGQTPLSQAEKLRLWRHDAYMQHHYKTAEFVGDKVLTLTNDANDAFWLAQIYYSQGNFVRAKQLLEKQELDRSVSCRYLIALCLTKMNEWDEALEVLGRSNPFRSDELSAGRNFDGGIKLEASMCYLRGRIYANQNNFELAKDCYKEALLVDVKCYEAFDELINNHLLTPQEEKSLVESLDFEGSVDDNAELAKALYITKVSKYADMAPQVQEAEQMLREEYNMAGNPDLLQSKADKLFVQCKFQQCLEVCQQLVDADQYNFAILPMYLACLHELGGKNRLFLLAHKLADNHPYEPTTWLAVGVYYLSIGKIPEARRFFSKASLMNPHFGQAWIGFAHTFAVEGEHEQAISAYSTAARLFQGTHLPALFLGMQYLQMNNLTLAEEYLKTSFNLCHTDPLLLNEIGVVYYHKNDLTRAEQFFFKAFNASKALSSDPRAWMSIQANLGHVYRRMNVYEKAVACFEHVLQVNPRDGNVHSALGLIELKQGRIVAAVERFHTALALHPNDPIALDLLKRSLEENSYVSLDGDDPHGLNSALERSLKERSKQKSRIESQADVTRYLENDGVSSDDSMEIESD